MIYKLKIFSVLLLFIGIQTGVSQEVASNYSKEIQLNKFRMFEKAEATNRQNSGPLKSRKLKC